jgi:stearoyl-CoA desaturase (delta-9 desaturase)
MTGDKKLPLDWRNIILLTVVHTVSLGGGAVYLALHGTSWAIVLMTAVLIGMSIFSISAGYHRLFSHRTYEAGPLLKGFLLFMGAGTFQNSVLAWAADHRRHHGRTDTDLDPYDARRGFWHAHIGWVLYKPDPDIKPMPVLDLQRDWMVAFQDRYYALVGVAAGVVLPILIGLCFGDPWGGFVVGGAVRLLVVYHVTFSINSFAHFFGAQPYSDRNSARDSFFTALVSMGEGYHNFHHTFPSDYRNGVRAHQFDPTKWTLRLLELAGAAKNLRRTPRATIVRARVRMDEQRLAARPLSPDARERLQRLRAAIDEAATKWHALVSRYEELKKDAGEQARRMLRELRAQLREARRELYAAYASWQRAIRSSEMPTAAAGA